MDFETLLPLQSLATLAIVIGLAFWSYKVTRRKLAERKRHSMPKSALARSEPDPNLKPDADVTDPHHVTDAHAADPDHRVDASPRDVGPSRPEATPMLDGEASERDIGRMIDTR